MKCPKCNGSTRVSDTRSDGIVVCRQRYCVKCFYNFYTTERQSDGKGLTRCRTAQKKSTKTP